MKLRHKIAVITGAGQGIGRGIAEIFANEGADMSSNDLKADSRTSETQKVIESKGVRA